MSAATHPFAAPIGRLADKPRRLGAIVVLACVFAFLLTACSPGEPDVVVPVVTTPQASLEGEWVLTRTVTASDDLSNPDRAVGAQSTRLFSITQSSCDTALCPGTVTSGSTPENSQTTDLTQTDGGAEWLFSGALNCLNAESGLVHVVDAFEFTQIVKMVVTETADEAGVQTASKLEGTITFSDSLTLDAHKAGCKRDPVETSVEFSVTATRVLAEDPAVVE